MENYRKRIADEILLKKLEGKGAVLIEGPKWCGKTTTAEQIAGSILYMDEPEKREQNIVMASVNPKRLLVGETPRLIDEWQIAETMGCSPFRSRPQKRIWSFYPDRFGSSG